MRISVFFLFRLLLLLPTCPTCIVDSCSVIMWDPIFPNPLQTFFFFLYFCVCVCVLGTRVDVMCVWLSLVSSSTTLLLHSPGLLLSTSPFLRNQYIDIPLGISLCFCPFILVRMILLQTFYLYSTHSHTFMNVKDDIFVFSISFS